MKQLIFIFCLFSIGLNAQINIIDGDTIRTVGVAQKDAVLITANPLNPFYYAVFDEGGILKKEPVVTSLSPVLENTITTPPALPAVDDAYLIPTGATGAWAGQVNKIATWTGSVWTFYTPVTNNKTTVQTGSNTGLTYLYNGSAWIVSSVKNQLKYYNWTLTDAYKASDIVVYNNATYQANADIPANTVFVTGTTGATWKQIGVSGASEDYYVSATNSVTLNATAQTLLSITVTSSGRYEIEALLDFSLSYNQPIAYYIAKNGTSISQTRSGYQNTTASGMIGFTNGKAKVIVNLVAGDIITLQAYASFTSSTVGNREMFIKKIAGYLPVVGQTSDFGMYGITGVPNTANTIIPISLKHGNLPVSSNTITLKANTTYKLVANLNVRCGFYTYKWTDAAGVQLPNSNEGWVAAVNSTDPGAVSHCAATISVGATPIVVKLMSGLVSNMDTSPGAIAFDIQYSSVDIVQIGTSALAGVPASKGIIGTNSSGAFVAGSSAGFFPLGTSTTNTCQLDNVKIWMATGGTINVGAITGSFVANAGNLIGTSEVSAVTINTTGTNLAGWAVNAAGRTYSVILTDTTNGKVYQLTYQAGVGFTSNLLEIRRII